MNLAMVNNCKTQVGHFLRHSPAIKMQRLLLTLKILGNPISFFGSYLTGGPWEIRQGMELNVLRRNLYVCSRYSPFRYC